MSGWSTPSDFKNSQIKKSKTLPEEPKNVTFDQVKTLKKNPKHFHFNITELRNSNVNNDQNLMESQYTTAQGSPSANLTFRNLIWWIG